MNGSCACIHTVPNMNHLFDTLWNVWNPCVEPNLLWQNMTGTLLGSLFSHTCIPLKSPPTNHWNGSLSAGTPKTIGLLIQHLKHYITLPTLPTFDCSGGLLSFEILRWPQFPPPTGSVAPQTRPHRRHRHGDPGGSRRLRPALGRWAALPAARKRWKDRGSARCVDRHVWLLERLSRCIKLCWDRCL